MKEMKDWFLWFVTEIRKPEQMWAQMYLITYVWIGLFPVLGFEAFFASMIYLGFEELGMLTFLFWSVVVDITVLTALLTTATILMKRQNALDAKGE